MSRQATQARPTVKKAREKARPADPASFLEGAKAALLAIGCENQQVEEVIASLQQAGLGVYNEKGAVGQRSRGKMEGSDTAANLNQYRKEERELLKQHHGKWALYEAGRRLFLAGTREDLLAQLGREFDPKTMAVFWITEGPPRDDQSIEAYEKDEAELLNTHPGEWVAYVRGKRICFGRNQVAACGEARKKGFTGDVSLFEITTHVSRCYSPRMA
jgi:hypothetical protein